MRTGDGPKADTHAVGKETVRDLGYSWRWGFKPWSSELWCVRIPTFWRTLLPPSKWRLKKHAAAVLLSLRNPDTSQTHKITILRKTAFYFRVFAICSIALHVNCYREQVSFLCLNLISGVEQIHWTDQQISIVRLIHRRFGAISMFCFKIWVAVWTNRFRYAVNGEHKFDIQVRISW
jgi:hypothetical protein